MSTAACWGDFGGTGGILQRKKVGGAGDAQICETPATHVSRGKRQSAACRKSSGDFQSVCVRLRPSRGCNWCQPGRDAQEIKNASIASGGLIAVRILVRPEQLG